MDSALPSRIVCLTEETTETLYRIGEADRIVGISGFTVRPRQARKEKPRVSAFTSAKIDKILALSPDLVLGFSDLQADIAHELIKAGVSVMVFNHRSIEGILGMMRTLGAMVGAAERAEALVHECIQYLAQARSHVQLPRPRVYFEEWDSPQISAIRWVSELIEAAGGEDIFPELARYPDGKSRIICDPQEVVRRKPDIIIGSWCGKKFRPEKVATRPDWGSIPAVRTGALYEVKSVEILQPGPAALTDGLARLCEIIHHWHGGQGEGASVG